MSPLPRRSSPSGIVEAEDLRSLANGDAPRKEATLGDRIETLLRSRFVGRERELDAFDDALQETRETSLLFVLGELGVGKTALVRRFAAIASARGSKTIIVDGKVEVPELALESAVLRLQAVEANAPKPVLVIDHIEPKTVRWFVETLLPSLPHDALVVIADRRELSRFDIDSNLLTPPFCQVLIVPALADEEALEYLARRDVPLEARASVVANALGLPLFLIAGAEAALDAVAVTFEDLEARALVHRGVEMMAAIDEPHHAAAAAALALAESVSLELLTSVLGSTGNVRTSYTWLASLSYVEHGSSGLRPHRVARTALLAMLRREHPRLLAQMTERLRRYEDDRTRPPFELESGPQVAPAVDGTPVPTPAPELKDFPAMLRAKLNQLAEAAGLSAREKEVLDLVVLGRNSVEIGSVLEISARTAKFHQARLLAKLGADSRIDLFRLLL